MKFENLPFSLFIVFIATVALAILGHRAAEAVSFVGDVTYELAPSSPLFEVRIFAARALLGCVLLGMLNGVYLLWRLFDICMSNDR